MRQPYPWTHPAIIQEAARNRDRDPIDLMRQAVNRKLGAPPESPTPWMLIIPVEYTRPNPDNDSIIRFIEFFPRLAHSVRMHLHRIMRPDAVIDVTYAKHRGKFHPISILSDAVLKDDYRDSPFQRLTVPPESDIGKAVHRTGTQNGVRVRHWQATHGSRIWKAMKAECNDFERAVGVKVNSIHQYIEELAQLEPDEWTDYIERLLEGQRQNREAEP